MKLSYSSSELPSTFFSFLQLIFFFVCVCQKACSLCSFQPRPPFSLCFLFQPRITFHFKPTCHPHFPSLCSHRYLYSGIAIPNRCAAIARAKVCWTLSYTVAGFLNKSPHQVQTSAPHSTPVTLTTLPQHHLPTRSPHQIDAHAPHNSPRTTNQHHTTSRTSGAERNYHWQRAKRKTP